MVYATVLKKMKVCSSSALTREGRSGVLWRGDILSVLLFRIVGAGEQELD